MVSEVHAITFDKSKFTTAKAKAWLKKHNYKIKLIEKFKPNILWFNITPKQKYKRFSTIKTSDGVNLILGYY